MNKGEAYKPVQGGVRGIKEDALTHVPFAIICSPDGFLAALDDGKGGGGVRDGGGDGRPQGGGGVDHRAKVQQKNAQTERHFFYSPTPHLFYPLGY